VLSSNRRIERDDVVCINVFPSVWGYKTELERTLLVGSGREADALLLDAATESFLAARAALSAGRRMSEVDAIASQTLIDRGLGDAIRHGTGHALGIRIGAAGNEFLGDLRPYNSTVLEPGMVSSIEPGVYIPGHAGFRHSDTLVVTAGEPMDLTGQAHAVTRRSSPAMNAVE
jgi:Xaa-Pro aminopeptidase